MNLENIPRKYLMGVILLTIVVLIVVTLVQPSGFLYRDKTDYDSLREQALREQQEYSALLASVKPNYEASKELLQEIASEELVRKEVVETLQANQSVVIPTISDQQLAIAERSDATTIEQYLTDFKSMASNYNQSVAPAATNIFGNSSISTTEAIRAKDETNKFVNTLRSFEVPKDAVAVHKANIVTYEAYVNFFEAAAGYTSTIETDPWPEVYKNYAVINHSLTESNNQLNSLDQKFSLGLEKSYLPESSGFGLIPEAQALFGGLLVIDVQRIVVDGIKTGLARSFATFAVSMLDKFVSHIEKNFAIASQLYYSNELGRFYSLEYMQKFVSDPLDQAIIQKFLPEYFCIPKNKDDLRQIYQAKARENIGENIVMDPTDPDFFNKLAVLGTDEKNYPSWWGDYYETMAFQTQRQAESAASKEVVSPGLKSGRDLVSGQVNKTMSSILGVQEAAIAGTINLGTNNTENIVGALVASTIESLVNKFVFTPLSGGSGDGSTGGPGGLSVLIEKDVCLSNPLVKPIASVPQTNYENPEVPAPAYP